MRCRTIPGLILAVGAGCGAGSEPVDLLDRELVRELSLAQGTASGGAHSGFFELQLSADACDCPSLEVDGETVDLCTITEFGGVQTELSEGSGVLAISSPAAFGLFTGAIETDGSFVVAGIEDLSTVAGPLESIHRMDGEFSDDDSAEGWVGQRVIGEIPGQDIDCRWTGSFVLTRM